MELSLDFKIRDRVNIHEINVNGRIVAIFISEDGVSYRVRYFYDGYVRLEYFYDDELVMIEKETRK